MLGKVFLLAVVCVSFVQVRGDHKSPLERGFSMLTKGNHFVDTFKTEIQSSKEEPNKTSDQELEDAITEGLLVADSIHKLTVRLLLKQWKNLDEIRQIIVSNSTEYTSTAKSDEKRLERALYKTAENVREEARYLVNSKLIVQCVDKVEHKAYEDVNSNLKTFVAEIWHLNFEFNKTYPEYPFLMLEEVLKHPYNLTIQSINGCKDTQCVQAVVKKYNSDMNDFYNVHLKEVTRANTDFIAHQQEVFRFYRRTTKEIEKIYLVAVGEMRKCLYIRPVTAGKLLTSD